MGSNEVDLTEYLQVLEQFRQENTEEIKKYWGSIGAYDDFVANVKAKQEDVARVAIKQYGSIEKYTEAMRESMGRFSEMMDKLQEFRPQVEDYIQKNNRLMSQLTADITLDISSAEVQDIVGAIISLYETAHPGTDKEEHYWDRVIDGYLNNDSIMKVNDEVYGAGASEFIGKAFQKYFK